MMEIKFRAWDKKHQRMFSNDYLMLAYEGIVKAAKTVVPDAALAPSKGLYMPLGDPNMVFLQFTGLRDKNRRDIYEGDIVTAWSQGYCGKFDVRWRQEGSPCWILYPAWQNREMWHLHGSKHGDGLYYDDVEVIGNIFENPELLEGKMAT